MKRLFTLAAAVLFYCSGCQSTGIIDKTYKNGELTKKVSVYRGSLATVTETKGLKIDYHGVKAELDIYSNRGDVEMVKQCAKAALFIAAAIQSGGTAPALSAVIEAMLAPDPEPAAEPVKKTP